MAETPTGVLTPRLARARYRRIVVFALRFMVVEWWYGMVLPRLGLIRLSRRGRTERFRRFAARFHDLAIELGGLMIKVGQFMSSRLDILPPEVTDELAGLQDEVPAVAFPAIRELAEAELGMPLDQAFASFDAEPMAAASLGQAHRARLTGLVADDAGFADVVVKVQRPGIRDIVEVDLAALRKIAGWVSRVTSIAARVDAPGLVEEFATTSLQEIDYLHEAASAERFAEDFEENPRIGVPRVAWERTTRQVLVLEDVTAIKVGELDAIRAAGIDPAAVADELAESTFAQFFEHGFFHADPHPGNLFVTPATGDDEWRLTYVDFGMMGEIPDELREGLRDLIVAVVARDAKGFVDGISAIGVLLPSADTATLERAMRELFDRFGGMAVGDLGGVDHSEMVDFADRFGDTLRDLPVQLPEDFLLIVRGVSLVSGVCSALNPEFNMWEAVEPFAATLMREEGTRTLQDLGGKLLASAGTIVRLPQRIDDVTSQLEQGRLTVKTPAIERQLRALQRTATRVVSAVIFAGLLIGGAVLHATEPTVGVALMGGSALPLLHALLAGRRPRRHGTR